MLSRVSMKESYLIFVRILGLFDVAFVVVALLIVLVFGVRALLAVLGVLGIGGRDRRRFRDQLHGNVGRPRRRQRQRQHVGPMKGAQSEGGPRQNLRCRAGRQNRVPSGETRVTPKFTRDVKTPDPIFHLKRCEFGPR